MKKTYVGPSGNKEAKLAIVGDQPGIDEVRFGKPFIGRAGQELDRILTMCKISKHELYITNVIKDLDAPLSKYINVDTKGKYAISTDGYQYIKELGEELSALKINAILATGNIPLIALCNRVGISKWRGSILESTIASNLKVIPTFHPSTILPPTRVILNRPLICEDVLLAKKESGFRGIRRISRSVITAPHFNQAIDTIKHCHSLGLQGHTIDLDIEVINGEVDCIALCWDPCHAISIPFYCQSGPYFTDTEELEIIKGITRIIQSPHIALRGANIIFDLQFLFRKWGAVPHGDIHCTQIAQKIAFPDFKAGLDFVTSMHTDIPYYKQDGKQWMKMGMGTWNRWWEYNGMDAIATAAAHPNQIVVLDRQSNIPTYDRQRKLIPPLIYMAERGIKIDVAGMVAFKETEQARLELLVEDLYREIGYEVNYNSSAQLMKYFYEEKKITPYKNRKTHKPTLDVNALKRISRRGFKAAQIMLDIRSLSKRISTYLNIGKVDEDGRYRSSYKPVGAETGRLSSGETIFGTGGNQQNWPHDLLRFFLFDEGYIGYSFDLSQIENRIVAYVGGIIPMISAFEQGIDLHRLTASIIFNKSYDQISGEDGSSNIGDGRQSERFWGKKGNHALNYDVGYRTFALVNEMTETEAKHLINKLHNGYPQIREGYHKTIQNMLFKNRMVTNLFGRNRLFLGPIHPSHPSVTQGDCLATFREAYAQLPQSTCADKINEQGLEYIYYNQDQFDPVEILAQIHDSVVFQIPLSLPWIEHAKILLSIKKSLETPLQWHDYSIETPADLCIGLNMSKEEMTELKSKKIPTNPEILANELFKIYHNLKG